MSDQYPYGSPEPNVPSSPQPVFGVQAYQEPYTAVPGAQFNVAEPKRGAHLVWKAAGVAAAVSLVVGGIAGVGGFVAADLVSTAVQSSSSTYNGGTTAVSNPTEIETIAKRTLPTVVSIEVKTPSGGDSGSGFIIRQEGYIVTNNHVVEPGVQGGTIRVRLNDDTIKTATIVGRNPAYDVAVLKVDAAGLPVASLGDSKAVKVGQMAVALGSPLGLSDTVTSGIVSAVNRPVTTGDNTGSDSSFIDAIQTDAAINPGNSGGPLVNSKAEVIGMNSAIASTSQSAGNIGVGFAIPSNTVRRVADELIASGKSTTPIIGVQVKSDPDTNAAVVGDVTTDSPGAKAGIKPGDLITAVNGRPVDSSVGLITTIRSLAPGDTVTLTVKTGDQTRDVKVVLAAQTN